MIYLNRKQAGLSLVELMIAISLSLVLTLGVIQIFSSSQQTSRVQNAVARMQENARFALDLLGHDIRMAGQLGCNSNANITNNTDLRDFGNGIFGYEYSDTLSVALTTDTSDPNPDSSNVVANTDALIVMAASPLSIPATSDLSSVAFASSNSIGNIQTDDPLIISDCDNADIFLAGTTITGTGISIKSGNFSKSYQTGAELAKLHYSAYYVKLDNGVPNLYRSYVGNGTVIHEPLLEGVRDIQILYGEDTNGDGSSIRYVDAKPALGINAPDWSRITSVRVHLLLSTVENNLATTPQSYWQQGELVTPSETANQSNKIFQAFTTTIQLRNQGIGI